MLRALCLGFLYTVAAQRVGTHTEEYHPPFPVEACTTDGGCKSEEGSIVMDVSSRRLHNATGYNKCLDKKWDAGLCPTPKKCAKDCAVEGVDEKGYKEKFKVEVVEKGVKLSWPESPRLYMLEDENTYKIFKLKNQEFSFDVDLSSVPCGITAALYFSEMPAEGDTASASTAGAKYGTGYCDAHCPHMDFIHGKANEKNWTSHRVQNPDGKWVTTGPHGKHGICCNEMDILEANSQAESFSAHPCSFEEQKVCKGDKDCGNRLKGYPGICDQSGCAWASYKLGQHDYWGPGSKYTVDTRKPMTVVTQFITSDSTSEGDLIDIRRIYIQDGKVVKNSRARNVKEVNSTVPYKGRSINDDFCDAAGTAFMDNDFKSHGGMKQMGEAIGRGMVLAMSIWNDNNGRMLWLDGKLWVNASTSQPGQVRGRCPFEFGTNKDEEKAAKKEEGGIHVLFTNVRYGDIGSTFSEGGGGAREKKIQVKVQVIDDHATGAVLHGSEYQAYVGGWLLPAVGGLLIAGFLSMGLRLRKGRSTAEYGIAPGSEVAPEHAE